MSDVRRNDRMAAIRLSGHQRLWPWPVATCTGMLTPMVTIGSLVLNVADVERASAFWRQALGYRPSPENPAVLVPDGGAGPALALDEDDRTHLDLRAANAAEQRAEVARLVALGARQVDWEYPEDADFVVLCDPEGNLFCVINANPDE